MNKKLYVIFTAVGFFLLFTLFPVFLYAEEVIDYELGYSLDIPEGFETVAHTQDGMSYLFTHKKAPVNLVLRLYPDTMFGGAGDTLKGALEKLNAQAETDTFIWQNMECSITTSVIFTLNSEKQGGWAISVLLPQKNINLVLICYAPYNQMNDWQQFFVSILNSLSLKESKSGEAGIITSYGFPRNKKKQIQLNIANKIINTFIDEEDIEASKFVIDCEFSVLKLYINDEKWKEAWQRYYKIIFKDSYARLKDVSMDIYTALYPIALKNNKDNPTAELNAMLLEWVQNMEYKRAIDYEKSDFTPVPAVISGEVSDCDSRSMTICAIMENIGVDSTLFISREYSHAIYGINIIQNGAKIKVGDKEYLLNETTAKGVRAGLIAQDMNDTAKWIEVELP